MRRGLIALGLTLGVVGGASAVTEVNTCGQVLSGTGFLAADLDCSGFTGDAVTIDGGALDLRGFTLTGGTDAGVFCSRNCKVVSDPPGGRIENSGGYAIDGVSFMGSPTVTARAKDVILDGNNGALRALTQAILVDSSIVNDGGVEVLSSDSIKIIGSTLSGIGGGPNAFRTKVFDSRISNCGGGCVGTSGRLRILDSDISNNSSDGVEVVSLSSVRVMRSTISNNAARGVSDTFSVKKARVFVDSENLGQRPRRRKVGVSREAYPLDGPGERARRRQRWSCDAARVLAHQGEGLDRHRERDGCKLRGRPNVLRHWSVQRTGCSQCDLRHFA